MRPQMTPANKRGETTISQLLGLVALVLILVFINVPRFRTFCLGVFKGGNSASSTTSADATASENTVANMGLLKGFFRIGCEHALNTCRAYSEAWQGAINGGWDTPESALEKAKRRCTDNRDISFANIFLEKTKTMAATVNESGSDYEKRLASECVGTLSELVELANQPRGSLMSFNSSIDRLEGQVARLKGQLDVYEQ